MFKHKTVLVTGGTGSFGTTILPKLLERNVNEIRVFSRDEEKQLELKRKYAGAPIKFILGDVRDYKRVKEAVDGANIVYHAAAQKIIDSCEENPTEAIETNIKGTLNVKIACEEHNVETAVYIGTDKAVKPINLYGMTKAIAEKTWLTPTKHTCRFVALRYGNVIGSRGSVIPYFHKLISENKPLPITHPEMTRFLITLKQAHELVFHVTTNGKTGEIYIPELPSCQITTLAKAMAGENYPTKIVGIRQGEKIHECLINEYETLKTIKQHSHYIILPKPTELNEKTIAFKEYTSNKANLLNIKELKKLIEKKEDHT